MEGVGGFDVPLNREQSTADLARAIGLPVVLVVGMRLGCINHALLTAEAIARDGLHLAGWVANHAGEMMPCHRENLDTLRRMLPAPLLGEVPALAPFDAGEAAKSLSLQTLMS